MEIRYFSRDPGREVENQGTKEPGNQGTREPRNQGTREPGNQGAREPGNQKTREPGNPGTWEPRNSGTKEPDKETRKPRRGPPKFRSVLNILDVKVGALAPTFTLSIIRISYKDPLLGSPARIPY